jgi:tRNA(Ile)-lysidine synthase
MLVALARAREASGFRLCCLHIDHGIRSPEECAEDARAVQALCARFAVPCRVVSLERGLIVQAAKEWNSGIEAAARRFRMGAWEREAARTGAVRVLAAHTRDDLLETALMRILRGAGPAGLAPMRRERGLVLRPLLALGRRDAVLYLTEQGIPWQTDSTNSDLRYLRNRVRHKLIPCLDAFFPQWRGTLPRLAETQRMAADLIADEARVVEWRRTGADQLEADSGVFFALPLILREEALFQAVDALTAHTPQAGQAVKRSNLRCFSGGGLQAVDAGLIRLEQQAGRIGVSLCTAGERTHSRGFALLIREPGVYDLSGLGIGGAAGLAVEVWADGFMVRGIRYSASLPLVFRQVRESGGSGKATGILAEDRNGLLVRIAYC